LGGVIYLPISCLKNALAKGKQWNTIIIPKLCSEQCIKYWGVKYISSGLGAIIGACVPVVDCHCSFFQALV
jgi:hypothetical protein